MADKFHSDTKEKLELIYYDAILQDSQDLEAGTHTIVPTSRPAVGSAQYSKSLTLAKPADARIEVKRICTRLNVNITNLGTATHVYLSVRVDADDTEHELFSEDWTATGSKLDAVDTHSGSKATIFNSLKDGQAHTFYFLFWADQASQAPIDLVQLWVGVGTCSTSSAEVTRVSHTGFIEIGLTKLRVGTGTATAQIRNGVDYIIASDVGNGAILALAKQDTIVRLNGTVATDLNYLQWLHAILRTEP